MQKKIIALAVAGLMSGAAFAQSNVTVYGVADAYWVHGSGDGNDANAVNSGGLAGSRLGFKGVEDLGGGLKAVFTLEYALAVDTNSGVGTGALAARQQYVGLTGGFGTAVAGRLQTPGYNFGVKYDAHAASLFSPVGQLTDNAGASISGRDANARQDNSVAYVSPSFGGLTVVAAYSYGTGGEVVDAGVAGVNPQNIWALSADYDAGPLSIGFTHHNVNDFGNASGVDQTENALGVKYNLGIATLAASYQTQDVDSPAGTLWDSKLWNIGARVNAGSGTVGISYAQIKDDVSNNKAKSWGLDYRHPLSKRTTAYVGYSHVSNSNGAAAQLLNVNSFAAVDGKESQFAVGLNHSF